MNRRSITKQAYLERDISWMYFNNRILLQADRKDVPLLERLKFLGIYSNNLDEFFRVRVATVKRIRDYSDKINVERTTAINSLDTINKLNKKYTVIYERIFNDIKDELKDYNINIISEAHLSKEQEQEVINFYVEKLNGSTNPVFIRNDMDLSKQRDEDIYLAVCLSEIVENKTINRDYAVIRLPVEEYGRFVKLSERDGTNYIMFLDDVIRFCLPYIFKGVNYNSFQAYTFKFTKDAEMEFDSDISKSVLQKVSKAIRKRKLGEAIRFVYDSNMPKTLLRRLMKYVFVNEKDTILPAGRYHNLKDLMSFPDCGRNELKYKKQPALLESEYLQSMMEIIGKKDYFLHFPFHSFDIFLGLLGEAAINKDVKSISITVYRLAKKSKVIKSLIAAAKNGKNVTVVIELMARFDEESNIEWSKKLEEEGIKVVFGIPELKVHSKLLHISSRSGDIACIGTGNMHEGTAQIYTDYMLMTSNKKIVSEVEKLFKFIRKPYNTYSFKELLVSPNDMRRRIIYKINREIKNANEGKVAYIMAKLNHITDISIISKLYQASTAGVKIDLLVRGNCSILTGIKGLSENIRVFGIINRYLEHSRILRFANGGNDEYYIGSADFMPRNLDRRVEVFAPIYDKNIIKDLNQVLEFGLKDTDRSYIVDGHGKNNRHICADEPFDSQDELYKYYKNNVNEYRKN